LDRPRTMPAEIEAALQRDGSALPVGRAIGSDESGRFDFDSIRASQLQPPAQERGGIRTPADVAVAHDNDS
jgi:hypothetical protein